MDNKKAIAAGAAVLVVIVGALVIFTGGDDTSSNIQENTSTETTQTTNSSNNNVDETPTVDADRVIEVGMDNYEFTPASLTASPGETVTINLTNNGGTHDFVIDELDVQSQAINGGETTSVTFTIPTDATGSYTFYCSISNHRELGMEGQLNIQ